MRKYIRLGLVAFLSLSTFAQASRKPQNILNNLGILDSKKYDEAMLAVTQKSTPANAIQIMSKGSDDDYYKDMDYGLSATDEGQNLIHQKISEFIPEITKDQAVKSFIRGRNNWIVWTGGNDRFWNFISNETFGSLDFLKLISNDPNQPYSRNNRWQELGLVNEPCFTQNSNPLEERWGLRLDVRKTDCAADPYANESKYPGIKLGARGKQLTFNGKPRTLEVGSFYGLPTGVVGLRLFTNPAFTAEAAKKWDPVRYYNDPTYYNDPYLVKPYRVGMSCAFCHVGPNPVRPPSDFNNPSCANLNSNPGAQYFWFERVFNWNYKKNIDNFVLQLTHTYRPGALDTSLISSDQINNPRTMNAIYDMKARIMTAMNFGHHEKLMGDELANKQFNSLPQVAANSPLVGLFSVKNSLVTTPRVLKDGADSVGVLGALNRVYVNIGLYSEHWLDNFIPIIGGGNITPFQIKKAEKESGYWQANTSQTPDLGLFLLVASKKDDLSETADQAKYLKDMNSPEVMEGKKLFAENCASCHSSKAPAMSYSLMNRPECVGKGYLNCWNQYLAYTQTSSFKDEMKKIVFDPYFLKDNFLSTELRVPANYVDTQVCSSLATNAIAGNTWDNFSSNSYKNLPSIGDYTFNYPLDLNASKEGYVKLTAEKKMTPAGGRGYIRPASLISVWSSAPFLQNNSVGKFDYRGTVEGRMSSFNDSIHKLLNPDLRAQDPQPGELKVSYTTGFGAQSFGFIDVTTKESYLKIPIKYVPYIVKSTLGRALSMNGGFFEKDSEGYTIKFKNDKTYAFKSSQELFEKNNRQVASEDYKESTWETDDQMGLVLKIGPIPEGVPVNMITNLDLTYAGLKIPTGISNAYEVAQGNIKLIDGVLKLTFAIFNIQSRNLKFPEARNEFMRIAAPALIATNKCSDLTVNRGHYFGTKYAPPGSGPALTETEQAHLIEYIKHF